MKILAAFLLGATFTVQMAADPDGPLEPSVLNEVEHALDRAAAFAAVAPANVPTNAPPVRGDVFGTNGLSAAAIAISLVSRQDAAGGWTVGGTNVTAEAVRILRALAEPFTNR